MSPTSLQSRLHKLQDLKYKPNNKCIHLFNFNAKRWWLYYSVNYMFRKDAGYTYYSPSSPEVVFLMFKAFLMPLDFSLLHKIDNFILSASGLPPCVDT